jgi:hypothetical protein
MEEVAIKLIREGMDAHGYGGIANIHRDWCGLGMVYTDYPEDYLKQQNFVKPGGTWDGRLGKGKKVFSLQEVHDGYFIGRLRGIWDDKLDFVRFWASQSDFSCSGVDERPESRLFYEEDDILVCNQRVDRKRLEAYLKCSNIDDFYQRYPRFSIPK